MNAAVASVLPTTAPRKPAAAASPTSSSSTAGHGGFAAALAKAEPGDKQAGSTRLDDDAGLSESKSKKQSAGALIADEIPATADKYITMANGSPISADSRAIPTHVPAHAPPPSLVAMASAGGERADGSAQNAGDNVLNGTADPSAATPGRRPRAFWLDTPTSSASTGVTDDASPTTTAAGTATALPSGKAVLSLRAPGNLSMIEKRLPPSGPGTTAASIQAESGDAGMGEKIATGPLAGLDSHRDEQAQAGSPMPPVTAGPAGSGPADGSLITAMMGSFVAGSANDAMPAGPAPALVLSIDNPRWVTAMAGIVVRQAADKTTEATLKLHPRELGEVAIRIAVDGASVNVSFLSDSAQARTTLESALPQLRDMMSGSGLSLGEASVGQDRSARGRTENRENTQGRSETRGYAALAIEPPGSSRTAGAMLVAHRPGGIDLYA